MEEVTRNTVYFTCCGEANTGKTLQAACERCLDLGIRKIVIASETGRSALKAVDVFRETGVGVIVVTHYPAATWGPRGDIPIGLMREEYADIRAELVKAGAKIVQGTRPFAPPSRSVNWGYPTPEAVVDKTLELLGSGTKIAVEAAVMATDAGAVDEGEEVVSCAGTYKGLDTALVVKAAYSMNFFKAFEVREVVAKPRCRLTKLPEYEQGDWKGELDQYYERR